MARQQVNSRLKRYMHRRNEPTPWLHNGTWTITSAGTKLTNTPTKGSELFLDPGLETWLSATNLTLWTESTSGSSTVNQETSSTHGGSNAARLDVDSSGNSVYITQSVASVGTWYSLTGWAFSSPTGKGITFGSGSNPFSQQNLFTLTSSYVQYFGSGRATAASVILSRGSGVSASSSLYMDDVSLKALTLNTLFAVKAGIANPNAVGTIFTASINNPAGVVYGLDSYSSPANFIVGYHDGASRVYLTKCVSGTYTELVSVSVTYVAGAPLVVKFTGSNTYQLWYNGVQRGADQTITGMTGIYHGVFSTYSGNTFSNFWIA